MVLGTSSFFSDEKVATLFSGPDTPPRHSTSVSFINSSLCPPALAKFICLTSFVSMELTKSL